MLHNPLCRTCILVIVFLLGPFGCSLKNRRDQELPGFLYHVKTGDTVEKIAQRYKMSAAEIMEVNGVLEATALKAGQYLFIPETEVVLPSKVAVARMQLPVEDDAKKINLILPVSKGVLFRVFDKTPERLFEGIALGAPQGTPVHAAAKGEIIYVAENVNRFGRMIIIKHDDTFVSLYAHLERVDIAKGKLVEQGEVIGAIGTSGGVESPRLYFQVRKNRIPVDPERYFSKSR
jgi:murein DD-endopeptidase MepM/ murein hydrolase activator NlpD